MKSKKNKPKTIKILATSKLNSVNSIISKAIQACYISEKYCAFINKEVDKYKKLREKISKKIKSHLIEFEKKHYG